MRVLVSASTFPIFVFGTFIVLGVIGACLPTGLPRKIYWGVIGVVLGAALLFVVVMMVGVFWHYSRPVIRVPLATDITIGPEGVEFPCDPPIERRRNAGHVILDVHGDYRAEPPWDAILLNGKRIEIVAEVTTTEGEVFTSTIVGSGGGIQLRFDPDIPKGVTIQTIRITANLPVHCRTVSWYEWNPL